MSDENKQPQDQNVNPQNDELSDEELNNAAGGAIYMNTQNPASNPPQSAASLNFLKIEGSNPIIDPNLTKGYKQK